MKNRKWNYLIVILLMTIINLSCHQTPKLIEKYDFDKIFGKEYIDSLNTISTDSIKLNLCETIQSEWDSILIIHPYAPRKEIKALKLGNYSNIETQINALYLIESRHMLLFLSKKNIIGYGSVLNSRINFGTISDKNRSPYIKKDNCKNTLLVKYFYKDKPFYNVIIQE